MYGETIVMYYMSMDTSYCAELIRILRMTEYWIMTNKSVYNVLSSYYFVNVIHREWKHAKLVYALSLKGLDH